MLGMPPRVSAAVLLILSSLIAPTEAAAQVSDFFVPQFAGIAPPGFGLVDAIIRIINSLLLLAAIAAVVYIIISGVRYFSSQGDEDAARQAKLALIYGVIGILVILLAVVIVNFFSANITG